MKIIECIKENLLVTIPEMVKKTGITGKKLQKRNYRKETTGKTTERILTLCRNNPKITIQEMANELNLTEDGINFHLRNLRKKKKLIRIGGRKSGYWDIIED